MISFYHKFFKKDQITLLPLIKWSKSIFKTGPEDDEKVKDIKHLQNEFDSLQNKCHTLEDLVDSLVHQNNNILDSNRYLCMEMLKSQKSAELKMDKLIFYIITYMNAVNNQQKIHVDGA